MSNSSPSASPPRRAIRTYGRRKDVDTTDPSPSDAHASQSDPLAASRANAHNTYSRHSQEVESDSDGLELPPDTSFAESIDHDMQSERSDEDADDENAVAESSNVSDASSRFALDENGGFTFGWRSKLKSVDSDSVSMPATSKATNMARHSPLSPSPASAALDEASANAKPRARTPLIPLADTEDIFSSSLSTLTDTEVAASSVTSPTRRSLSSIHDSSLSVLPRPGRKTRRVHDSDSEDEEGDRTLTLPPRTQSPSLEHESLEASSPISDDPRSVDITPNKDTNEETPPTSDAEMPDASAPSSGKVKAAASTKGKAKARPTIPPLEFADGSKASAPSRSASAPKAKRKPSGEKKLKVSSDVFSIMQHFSDHRSRNYPFDSTTIRYLRVFLCAHHNSWT